MRTLKNISRTSLLLWIGILLVAAIYFCIDPSLSKWMPKCVFHAFTGWDCPGCGSQRMIHALLHGDIKGAWEHNAFFVVLIPVIIVYIILDFSPNRFPRLFRFMHSTLTIAIIGAASILWGLLRNII